MNYKMEDAIVFPRKVVSRQVNLFVFEDPMKPKTIKLKPFVIEGLIFNVPEYRPLHSMNQFLNYSTNNFIYSI